MSSVDSAERENGKCLCSHLSQPGDDNVIIQQVSLNADNFTLRIIIELKTIATEFRKPMSSSEKILGCIFLYKSISDSHWDGFLSHNFKE